MRRNFEFGSNTDREILKKAPHAVFVSQIQNSASLQKDICKSQIVFIFWVAQNLAKILLSWYFDIYRDYVIDVYRALVI